MSANTLRALFTALSILTTAGLAPGLSATVPATVHPNWTKLDLRPAGFEPQVSGMAFLSDGRLVVAHWNASRGRGSTNETPRAFTSKVHVLSGVLGDAPSVTVDTIAEGLEDLMGLAVVNDTIYASGGNVIVRLNRTDNNGPVTSRDTVFILPGTPVAGSGDSLNPMHGSQEYLNGLLYRDGKFYVSPSSLDPIGTVGTPQINPYRGTYLEVTPGNGTTDKRGSFRVMANGIRAASGLGFGPDGRHCVSDNQGEWLPSNKLICIQEGKFYGSKKSGGGAAAYYEPWNSLTETPPTVWAVQNDIANSPTAPLLMPFGPYAGQMLMGDVRWGTGINRYFLERNAEGDLQGAVFVFTGGLDAGVFRLALGPDSMLYVGMIGGRNDNDGYPKNQTNATRVDFGLAKLRYDGGEAAFEMLAVRSRPTGFEIEFTKPVDTAIARVAANYTVQSSHMAPAVAYGSGNKVGVTTLVPEPVLISPDRRKVFLTLSGLEPSQPGRMRMVHLRLNDFRSGDGDTLWSREAWYTLNAFGTGQPFDPPVALSPTRSPQREDAVPVTWARRNGTLYVDVVHKGAFTALLRDPRGRRIASFRGIGPGIHAMPAGSGTGTSGILILELRTHAPEASVFRMPIALP